MNIAQGLASSGQNGLLGNGIQTRFGMVPNFFRLAVKEPAIGANLWEFARFAYLDNPLPSLFKERLFVYLSLFCDVRYCLARHLGFLVGLGRPAGDPACLPNTIEEVLPLLRWILPQGEALNQFLTTCKEFETPISSYPDPDTLEERALFACATHVFLQTPDATRSHDALRLALTPEHLEHLNLLLSFVRTAHFWTKLHPELDFEDDIVHLLSTHEVLASCVLKGAQIQADGLTRKVSADLESLKDLRSRNAKITDAYEALNVDHECVKHSLEDRETTLRELVSAIPAAVYACDENGAMVYCNDHAVKLWGREPALDGEPWSFLDSLTLYRSGGIRVDPGQSPVRQVLATGLPVVSEELTLERPDLTRVELLANIAPLRGASGTVWGAVNILQDITEIKHRENEREHLLQELERSNRELSQFSYAVSHDLQAPVRSVRALTQLLVRREGGPPEDTLHLATLIEQASDGMQRLIESMLRYAQVGHGEPTRTRVSINSVVEAVRTTLAAPIAASNARIICKSLPEIEADPVQLQQVFENLIANAIKYAKAGTFPLIQIEGEPAEEGWLFTVTDNGEGIPLGQQHAIFEPLKRLHGSEKPGTGLGLAMCRAIVTRHGGRIWAESEGAGQGSTFRFTVLGAAPRSHLAVKTLLQRATSSS